MNDKRSLKRPQQLRLSPFAQNPDVKRADRGHDDYISLGQHLVRNTSKVSGKPIADHHPTLKIFAARKCSTTSVEVGPKEGRHAALQFRAGGKGISGEDANLDVG